jgi:hypothetical protein
MGRAERERRGVQLQRTRWGEIDGAEGAAMQAEGFTGRASWWRSRASRAVDDGRCPKAGGADDEVGWEAVAGCPRASSEGSEVWRTTRASGSAQLHAAAASDAALGQDEGQLGGST